jgi:hypothetical protein
VTRLPDPARSSALLIGASRYRHFSDLPAVTNNLEGFRRILLDRERGSFSEGRCTLIENPRDARGLYEILRRSMPSVNDTLLIYFSGHGKLGPRNELHLCLSDTLPDDLHYSSIPFDLLREVLSDSPAKNKVVILDCCFSGRAIADMADDSDTILGQVGIQGTYILTATPGNRTALAPEGEPYTSFSGGLLSILWSGIPDGPELLSFAAVYPRLNTLLTNRGLPRPRQQGTDTVSSLAIVRNVAYKPPAPIPEPLHPALIAALENQFPNIRMGAVTSLGEILAKGSPDAPAARAELERVANRGDLPQITQLARRLLLDTSHDSQDTRSPREPEHTSQAASPSLAPQQDDKPNRVPIRHTWGIPSWKITASMWLLLGTISCGFLTWAGFLIIGVVAHKRKWKLLSLIYAAWVAVYLVLAAMFAVPATPSTTSTIPDWLGFLIVTAWIGGVIHSILVNREWLRVYAVRRNAVGPGGRS